MADLVGDANTCHTSSENDYPLVAQRCPADPNGRDCRCQRNRARALHIVIENAGPVAVFFKDPPSIARRKVFPLQQRAGNRRVTTLK